MIQELLNRKIQESQDITTQNLANMHQATQDQFAETTASMHSSLLKYKSDFTLLVREMQ